MFAEIIDISHFQKLQPLTIYNPWITWNVRLSWRLGFRGCVLRSRLAACFNPHKCVTLCGHQWMLAVLSASRTQRGRTLLTLAHDSAGVPREWRFEVGLHNRRRKSRNCRRCCRVKKATALPSWTVSRDQPGFPRRAPSKKAFRGGGHCVEDRHGNWVVPNLGNVEMQGAEVNKVSQPCGYKAFFDLCHWSPWTSG